MSDRVDLVNAACIHWTAAGYGGDALTALDAERAEHAKEVAYLSLKYEGSQIKNIQKNKEIADLRQQLDEVYATAVGDAEGYGKECEKLKRQLEEVTDTLKEIAMSEPGVSADVLVDIACAALLPKCE